MIHKIFMHHVIFTIRKCSNRSRKVCTVQQIVFPFKNCMICIHTCAIKECGMFETMRTKASYAALNAYTHYSSYGSNDKINGGKHTWLIYSGK